MQDTFAFHSGFGLEQVTGFVPGAASGDVIQFDKALFADYAAVAGAMQQSGANVVISYDSHDQITLNHVTMAQLSAANFMFV